jgi:hypothetical protein
MLLTELSPQVLLHELMTFIEEGDARTRPPWAGYMTAAGESIIKYPYSSESAQRYLRS